MTKAEVPSRIRLDVPVEAIYTACVGGGNKLLPIAARDVNTQGATSAKLGDELRHRIRVR